MLKYCSHTFRKPKGSTARTSPPMEASPLLVISIFVLSVRMHERYMYPGLLLLLLAYVYKPSRLTYLCYGGFSILHMSPRS